MPNTRTPKGIQGQLVESSVRRPGEAAGDRAAQLRAEQVG